MILRIKLRMFPKERVILTYSTSYFLEQWIFGEGKRMCKQKLVLNSKYILPLKKWLWEIRVHNLHTSMTSCTSKHEEFLYGQEHFWYKI
jgi:hypothetical protein